jgi:hypothetical protein
MIVTIGKPWHCKPSNILKSHAWWCDVAEMVFVAWGSQIIQSPSEPIAIRPFLGYKLKIRAAFELVTATNWLISSLPVSTPFVQMTDKRSSTPLTPFGI